MRVTRVVFAIWQQVARPKRAQVKDGESVKGKHDFEILHDHLKSALGFPFLIKRERNERNDTSRMYVILDL